MMCGEFINLIILSLIIGVIVGLISSKFMMFLKNFDLNRIQESIVVLLFAFISYMLSEELGLSPIISLLFTGLTMSNYTQYNLSFQARDDSSVVSRILAHITEAFVFAYLGLTAFYYIQNSFSLSFVMIEIVIVTLGRFSAIIGVSFLLK